MLSDCFAAFGKSKNLFQALKNLFITSLAFIIVLFTFVFPVLAEGVSQQLPFVGPGNQPNNSKELEGFVDNFFAENMQKEHIPGAVFALVKDGKVFLSKGYGYADVDKKIPVKPEETIFRVASISKLFTAIAVMQLVEKGQINLNDDVNKHLKSFQLDNNFPQAITIAHLLTHTSGLDGTIIGTSASQKSEILPIGNYLVKYKPKRVRPPGEITAYSNYGLALAGYIVELTSGIPFAEYIDKNILQPLEMTHSSFEQPPPKKHFSQNLPIGYKFKNNHYLPVPFEYTNDSPAISLSTTANDMAKFMIAQLESYTKQKTNPKIDDKKIKILHPDTIREMHRQQFTNDPRIDGIGYTFIQRSYNNLQSLGHGGSMEGFKSEIYLLPSHNLGLFVAFNSNDSFTYKLIKELLHHYGYLIKNNQNKVYEDANIERFQGKYLENRFSQASVSKLFEIANYEIKIKAQKQTLIFEDKDYEQVKPLLFKEIGDEKYLAFQQDSKGKIKYLFDRMYPLKKLAWYETFSSFKNITIFSGIIFFSESLKIPIKILRKYNLLTKKKNLIIFDELHKTNNIYLYGNLVSTIVSSLNLLFILGIYYLVNETDDIFVYFSHGVPSLLMLLLYIPAFTLGLTFSLPIFLLIVWKYKYCSLATKIHFSLVTITALAFIPFLDYWNLLGFKF